MVCRLILNTMSSLEQVISASLLDIELIGFRIYVWSAHDAHHALSYLLEVMSITWLQLAVRIQRLYLLTCDHRQVLVRYAHAQARHQWLRVTLCCLHFFANLATKV